MRLDNEEKTEMEMEIEYGSLHRNSWTAQVTALIGGFL